jgi:hypothetical protein
VGAKKLEERPRLTFNPVDIKKRGRSSVLLHRMSPDVAHRCRCQRFEFTVGIGGRADMKGRAISANSDATDPSRTLGRQFCCAAQPTCCCARVRSSARLLLGVKRTCRGHAATAEFDPSETSAANFAVMHNAAFSASMSPGCPLWVSAREIRLSRGKAVAKPWRIGSVAVR